MGSPILKMGSQWVVQFWK